MPATDPTPQEQQSSADSPAPVVSIGLPVYNMERFVGRAIESVLAQEFRDFELIISDNASTDDTYAICERYAKADDRIQLSRNEENLGANPNFSKTFHLSSGKYFKWLAADDWIEPSYLAKCVQALDDHPEAVLSHPLTGLYDENEEFEGIDEEDPVVNQDSPTARFKSMLDHYKRSLPIFGLVRADVLRKTKLMPAISAGDKVFLGELSLHGKFHVVPEQLNANRNTESIRIPRGAWGPWWDSRNRGTFMPLYWLMLKEFWAIITRSPISFRQKIDLYLATTWHMIRKSRTRLLKEILHFYLPFSFGAKKRYLRETAESAPPKART